VAVTVEVLAKYSVYSTESISGLVTISIYEKYCLQSWVNLVGIGTGYGLDDQGIGVGVPVVSMIFTPSIVQTGSGVHTTSNPMVLAVLSRGESGRGVKLTTHLQLVSRSRKYGAIHPLPHVFIA
jgi:hypothetical protein